MSPATGTPLVEMRNISIHFGGIKAVERATHNCSPRVAEAVDAQVIPLAIDRGWTPSETAKAARKLVIALDPDGAKQRAAAAKNEADVNLYPGDDELAEARVGEAAEDPGRDPQRDHISALLVSYSEQHDHGDHQQQDRDMIADRRRRIPLRLGFQKRAVGLRRQKAREAAVDR